MTYDNFCGICLFRERTGEQHESPEYQKLKALADQHEDLLRESLSDKQKELLDKFTECITDISSISERDMFIAGFRLGMKLMIDVMKDD